MLRFARHTASKNQPQRRRTGVSAPHSSFLLLSGPGSLETRPAIQKGSRRRAGRTANAAGESESRDYASVDILWLARRPPLHSFGCERAACLLLFSHYLGSS